MILRVFLKKAFLKFPLSLLLVFYSDLLLANMQDCLSAKNQLNENTLQICDKALVQPNLSTDKKSIIILTQVEYLVVHNNFKQAENKLAIAFKTNSKMKENSIFRYNWLRLHGNISTLKDNYTEAMPYYENALAISKILNKDQLIANSYNDLGVVAFELGQYDKSLSLLKESLLLHKKNSNTYKTALIYANIANIYELQKNFDEALSYLMKALKLHTLNQKNQSDKKQFFAPYIAHVYEDMGDIYITLKQYSLAQEHLNKSLKIYQEFKHSVDQIRVLSTLSRSYIETNDFDTALKLIDEAHQIEASTESIPNLELIRAHINVLIKKNQFKQAAIFAQKALKTSQKRKKPKDEAHFLKLLSEIYTKTKEPFKALNYYKLYDTVNTKILDSTYNTSLSTLQSKLKLADYRHKVELLNQKINSKQNRTFLINISLLVSIIIVLLFSINKKYKRYLNNKKSKKRNKNKLVSLSSNTHYLSKLFNECPLPIICVTIVGEIKLFTHYNDYTPENQNKIEGQHLKTILPAVWLKIKDYFDTEENINKEIRISQNESHYNLPKTIQSLTINYLDFNEEMYIIQVNLTTSNKKHLELNPDQIRVFVSFCNYFKRIEQNFSKIKPRHSDILSSNLEGLLLLLNNITNEKLDKTIFDDNKASGKVVDLMLCCIEIWRRSTKTNRIDLAQKSGLWLISIDNGHIRTRTFDRYCNIRTIPKNPRWKSVIKTAYFILSNCDLTTSDRQLLSQKTEDLISYYHNRALGIF